MNMTVVAQVLVLVVEITASRQHRECVTLVADFAPYGLSLRAGATGQPHLDLGPVEIRLLRNFTDWGLPLRNFRCKT
jgi:hypothetical protein